MGNRQSLTTLIGACAVNHSRGALQLIAEHAADYSEINKRGDTPLILACKNKMNEVALSILANGLQSANINHANKFGETALYWACRQGLFEVALLLVEKCTGHIDIAMFGYACYKSSDLAMAMLQSGQMHLGEIGPNCTTALMYACLSKQSKLALAILATGKGHPDRVNAGWYTALIYACQSGDSEVALAILATGQGRPEHIDDTQRSALDYARKNKMWDVVTAIKNVVVPSIPRYLK
jgi:ankyrin repeat protein